MDFSQSGLLQERKELNRQQITLKALCSAAQRYAAQPSGCVLFQGHDGIFPWNFKKVFTADAEWRRDAKRG
jgi:hypothetical protein